MYSLQIFLLVSDLILDEQRDGVCPGVFAFLLQLILLFLAEVQLSVLLCTGIGTYGISTGIMVWLRLELSYLSSFFSRSHQRLGFNIRSLKFGVCGP